MKTITLHTGENVLVDDEDYEYLNKFKWYRKINKTQTYAVRATWVKSSKKTKIIRMHSEILNTNQFIDHKNGNGLDNQKFNLRLCTVSQNSHNSKKHKDNTTGYKGVGFKKTLISKPYYAQIKFDNKRIFLGYFASACEAAIAYNNAAVKYFKNFAKLNIIP